VEIASGKYEGEVGIDPSLDIDTSVQKVESEAALTLTIVWLHELLLQHSASRLGRLAVASRLDIRANCLGMSTTTPPFLLLLLLLLSLLTSFLSPTTTEPIREGSYCILVVITKKDRLYYCLLLYNNIRHFSQEQQRLEDGFCYSVTVRRVLLLVWIAFFLLVRGADKEECNLS
jgi:hypothetical protein